MKKITFNAPLNHKAYSYEPMQIEVEKVIPLYGKRFEQMRDHPLDDCPEIIENRELMYMEGNTAHCILFLDANGSDGILVEAEGSDYARKSQFISNGSAIVENVDAAATTEDGHPLVVMVDNTTKVEISKRDITNDNELAGATVQIIDDKCNVVEEWVSADKPHYIEAQLVAGKTYTLKETIAPDGYTIANSIDFTVNADGTVTPVVMYDEPVPDTPDTPTGDTTSRLPGVLLIAAGLVMVLIAGMGRKKKDDADEYAALCPDFIESEE